MTNRWLFAVLAAGALASGCARKAVEEAEAPAPVQVTGVTQEPIRRIVAGDGVLFALGQSGVMPNISKPVVKFYANRGDHVKEGQLVATLESRDLKAAVDNARAQVNQATLNVHSTELATVPESVVKAQADVESGKETLDAAKRLLDSQQKLFEQGALAGRRVDEARVAYVAAKTALDSAAEHLRALNSVSKGDQISTAKAQLQAAEAQLAAAEAQLSYAEIRSPRGGVVADRPTYEGEMAVPGTPLLTVMDISKVVARINIPQNQGGSVKVGQTADVIPADGGDTIQGRVTVDDTQGRRMKHLGLWLVEGYHVPAVALANLKKNREFHRGDEFMFTASNGATVFSRSHAAFDVKERPFLHQAKEAFSSPIMQIIAARVAEAYE